MKLKQLKKIKLVKLYIFTSVIFSVCLFLGGCGLPSFKPAEYNQVMQKSAQLTLAWDPPLTDITGRPTEVESYRIYYREYGTFYWRVLDEAPANENPQYTVEHEQLEDRLYDFAVRAVTVSGQESPLHSSLDNSADPMSGWYVFWVESD